MKSQNHWLWIGLGSVLSVTFCWFTAFQTYTQRDIASEAAFSTDWSSYGYLNDWPTS